MVRNKIGLSHELIIHPGVTIKEIIDERNMSQEELAICTGFSAKHVSEVINGIKDISARFANALEISLGISSSFWINLQGIYDKKVLELEAINNISEEELKILDDLKPILNYCKRNNIIDMDNNKVSNVLNMRKFLGITNLTKIPNLVMKQIAYRISNSSINVYTLYAWQKICDYHTDQIDIANNYDKEKLIDNLSDIRNAMFLEQDKMIDKLTGIFASCGIAFSVVKHFTGAPVQGYIQKKGNKVALSMTIRRSFADIFWFTLFHEIGHLLNDDFENRMLDFSYNNNEMEERADIFAENILLDNEKLKKLANKKCTIEDINNFAKEQNVIPSIVIGRLENIYKDYKYLANYKVRYKWIDE